MKESPLAKKKLAKLYGCELTRTALTHRAITAHTAKPEEQRQARLVIRMFLFGHGFEYHRMPLLVFLLPKIREDFPHSVWARDTLIHCRFDY